MKDLDTNTRRRLAEKLTELEDDISVAVTDLFFRRYPNKEIYEKTADTSCQADARFHLTFLKTAIEFGTEETFKQYVNWTSNVLHSRNIRRHVLQKFLALMFQTLEPHLTDIEKKIVRSYLPETPPEPLPSEELSGASTPSAIQLHQKVFLQALLAGDRHAARTIAFEAYSDGTPLMDIYVDLFQESLYEIGRLWESNRISVAQEHMATAITQYVMANLYAYVQPGTTRKGKGIITGVKGELHQIGANMVADVLEMEGWDIQFLGVNLPHHAILRTIQDFQPNLVGISATMVLQMPMVKDLIQGIKGQYAPGTAPRILVGGSAFRSLPDAYREIGADAFAYDLRSLTTLI